MNKEQVKLGKDCHLVLTVSNWMKNLLIDRKINAKVIPNGVSVSTIKNSDPDIFRKAYHLREDFVLYVGNAGRVKNADLVIKAAKKVPETQFVFTGFSMEAESMKKRFGSLPKNILMTGYVKEDMLYSIYRAARVVVCPSLRESFGRVILESMAAERPIVASNSGGMPELIKNGVDGYLFELQDIEDFINKIRKVSKSILNWREIRFKRIKISIFEYLQKQNSDESGFYEQFLDTAFFELFPPKQLKDLQRILKLYMALKITESLVNMPSYFNRDMSINKKIKQEKITSKNSVLYDNPEDSGESLAEFKK